MKKLPSKKEVIEFLDKNYSPEIHDYFFASKDDFIFDLEQEKIEVSYSYACYKNTNLLKKVFPDDWDREKMEELEEIYWEEEDKKLRGEL
jgi:hypothetical protein